MAVTPRAPTLSETLTPVRLRTLLGRVSLNNWRERMWTLLLLAFCVLMALPFCALALELFLRLLPLLPCVLLYWWMTGGCG